MFSISPDKQQNVIKSVAGNKLFLTQAGSLNLSPIKKSSNLALNGNSGRDEEDLNHESGLTESEANTDGSDMCCENWTFVNSVVKNKITCRLCDKDITGVECQLLFDREENVETRLGRKINIIINSAETEFNLSQYCCNVCTSKIEICFSLLVEIQASDEVIKQTYGNLSNGVSVDTSTQLFICGECKSTITGIKSFIRHYENHILKKTVINSRSDVRVSQSLPRIAEHPRENVLNGRELDGDDSREEVEDVKLCFKSVEKKNNKKTSDGESRDEGTVISDDCKKKNSDVVKTERFESENEIAASDFECEVAPSDDENEEGDAAGSADKDEDKDDYSGSESVLSSDASYKKLVDIVKRELEKSDSDDDPNVEITVNEDGRYYCALCNQVFEYKFMLVYHVARGHKWNGFDDDSGSEIYKAEIDDDGHLSCSQCLEVFLPSEIDKHLEGCVSEFCGFGSVLCHICGKICTVKQWMTHKKKHLSGLGGSWQCKLCRKKFKSKRILRSHLGEHDESKKKVCEICGKKFLPLSFFGHMMKHKEKKHVCKICGKGFTYNYALKEHVKVHKGAERLEPKLSNKRDRVFCWLCQKHFNSPSVFREHLKLVHNNDVEYDLRFACSMCDKKFTDMFGLKAHLKLIHEMRDEEISQFKSLPVYRYIECNFCNQFFNSENKVRIHMKRDHGLKPFEMEILKKECEKCGKKFSSKQNLIHHINAAHLNIKPMQCDVCYERFAKHSSLIYHKLRHSGQKPFQCEICHKTYRQRNDVVRHLARHVRDQEVSLEKASALNNSPSPLVLKRRIFLKDSSVNYQALIGRNRRRKTRMVEVDPAPSGETKMEYDDGSLMYVEEVMADEIQQPESPDEEKYITVKPVYNEETNTIILSGPELYKNVVENVSYRYMTPEGKDIPAVIVKKEVEI